MTAEIGDGAVESKGEKWDNCNRTTIKWSIKNIFKKQEKKLN